MIDRISKYSEEIEKFPITNNDELESFRLQYLSKKGLFATLFEDFKTLPPQIKKATGQHLNILKVKATAKYQEFKNTLTDSSNDFFGDLTLPPEPLVNGSRHPVSLIRREIVSIFSKIGFTVAEGPEIEDDWHVFSGLNFPEEHPARDMQD